MKLKQVTFLVLVGLLVTSVSFAEAPSYIYKSTPGPLGNGNGQASSGVVSNTGQVITAYADPAFSVRGTTAAMTGTTNTAIIASPGAGLRNYITSCTITNGSATVSTYVRINDGSTEFKRIFAVTNGGGAVITFPHPLRQTAATALNAQNVTTGSETYVSCEGFKAP